MGALGDLVQVGLAPRRRQAGLASQPRQPQHAVQGGADLVAGVGQEGALGPVGGLGGVKGAGQLLLGQVGAGHILGDPDPATGHRTGGVDGLGPQAYPERAAIAAAALALDVDAFTARQRRADLALQGLG